MIKMLFPQNQIWFEPMFFVRFFGGFIGAAPPRTGQFQVFLLYLMKNSRKNQKEKTRQRSCDIAGSS